MVRRPRTFFVVSASVFIMIAIGLVLLYRQQALDEVIRSQEVQNVVLTRALANVLWPRFAGHVKGASPAGLENFRASAAALEFNNEIAEIVRNTLVHRVKVYNVSGLTVFSSNLAQIGEDRVNYLGFRKAMDQRAPFSTLDFRDSFTGFSKILTSVYLVSSYIPIEGRGGEIEGVFEIYTEATPAMERFRNSVIRFGAIVAAGVALLYGGLGFVVRRAARGG